jgi:hypothetical protein
MGIHIIGLLIPLTVGVLLGMGLTALFSCDPYDQPDFDALRDAYEEGLLHGHLTTRAGTFERQEVGAMADEWLNRQIDDGNLPNPV